MKKRICLFLLLFLCIQATSLYAQWIQTNGPYAGSVNSFAVSGTNLFAATSGGVYLSVDYGKSWTYVGLSGNVAALAVSPNAAGGTLLFAGTTMGRVFLSTNNGTSWTAVDAGLPTVVITALALSPASGGSGTNLFVGTWGSGVFLSTDNGTSWTAASTGLPNSDAVVSFAVSGTNLFARTWGDGVFLSTNSGTRWRAVNTGLPDTVYALAVSGTNLFAGADSGRVFLSSNNGTSWAMVNSGFTWGAISSFAVSGPNLFAGTEYNGVFLSTNNGTNWTSVNTGLTDRNVEALAFCGTNLLAATWNGVFLSTNNGTSWTVASTGLENYGTSVYALGLSPNGTGGTNLFAGSVGDGAFLSSDNGTSWTAVDLPDTIQAFAVTPASGGSGTNVFAGAAYRGVFLSANYGTSWTAVNSGLTNTSVYALAVFPASRGSGTSLFAGTNGGVFLSTDNGTSWSQKGLTNAIVEGFAVSPNGTGGTNLFAGTYGGGVFLSTNYGKSWTEIGLARSVWSLAVSETNLFAGTEYYGVWRRSLSEFTFTRFITLHPYKVPSSWGTTYINGAVEKFGNIWLCSSAGVARTNGNVIDWALKSNGLVPGEGINWLEFIDASTIFAGGRSGRIYKTTNGGDAWSISFYDTTVTKFINKIRFFDARHGAACGSGITQTSKTAFLETTDGGSTWKNNNSRLMGQPSRTTVEFCPPSSTYMKGSYTIGTSTYYGIWRSTDLGVNWKWLPVGAGGSADSLIAASCLRFQTALKGLVGRSDSTLWGTTDGGTTWQLLGETCGNLYDISYIEGTKYAIGVGSQPGLIMKIDPDAGILNWQIEEGCPLVFSQFSSETAGYFTVGSVSDIFYATSVLVTDVAVAKYPPPTFRLAQNFPNPFNPGTTIRYELPEAANVSLTIFNILGQVVATLVDEKKEAGGYQVQWNASTVPSGIYFCRLRAGAHTETQKMVVAK